MSPAKSLSLDKRLTSLGVKTPGVQIGTAGLPAPKPANPYEIDSVIAGVYHPTPLGDVFVTQQSFSAEYRHGQSSITPLPFPLLAQWTDDSRIASLSIEKYAFLDTETSGLSGGTGTYAFLVGVGRFVDGQFLLQQFFMRDPAEEPALLEGLIHFLAPCEALVTFNGKAFDAPLLRTRYSLNRIPLPFKNYSHLDLLPLARRLWRDRLPSRALKYLEEHVLGLTRAAEEVPGYEIPWLYFDYLRTRDALNPQQSLTEADFGLAVKRLSILQKKRGDLSRALLLWEEAAEQGHVYAHIELAKHYEHKQRDIESAIKWTKSAREHIEQMDLPAYMRRHWRDEIEHRLARLERKLNLR